MRCKFGIVANYIETYVKKNKGNGAKNSWWK